MHKQLRCTVDRIVRFVVFNLIIASALFAFYCSKMSEHDLDERLKMIMTMFPILAAFIYILLGLARRVRYYLLIDSDGRFLEERALFGVRKISTNGASIKLVISHYPMRSQFIRIRSTERKELEVGHYLGSRDLICIVEALTGIKEINVGKWYPINSEGRTK